MVYSVFVVAPLVVLYIFNCLLSKIKDEIKKSETRGFLQIFSSFQNISKLSNLNQRLKFHVLGPKMGPFQFLRNGFLIERDAKTLQTCHKLLFYHDLFIMAGILLASSIELILPTVHS